jgi:hypothetical protein
MTDLMDRPVRLVLARLIGGLLFWIAGLQMMTVAASFFAFLLAAVSLTGGVLALATLAARPAQQISLGDLSKVFFTLGSDRTQILQSAYAHSRTAWLLALGSALWLAIIALVRWANADRYAESVARLILLTFCLGIAMLLWSAVQRFRASSKQ